MIKELSEEQQKEFDAEVDSVKKRALLDFRPLSCIDGKKTPNFTNHMEIIPYGNSLAVVKASKPLSYPFYNVKSLAERIKGNESGFFRNRTRHEFEGEALDKLNRKNIIVPERVYTSVEGVLVLKFYQPSEETKMVLREDSRYKCVLSKLAHGLGQIHQFGLHGEPSTNNSFVFGDQVYWTDFERFSINPSDIGRSRELAELVRSASRHSYRRKDDVSRYVFEGYANSSIVDMARLLL